MERQILKVRELGKPVVASKADWAMADSWMGFTPMGDGPGAEAQCQATIQKQFSGGLVLERVTIEMPAPNAGFENDPEYLESRDRHKLDEDRLIAIHELRYSSRHASSIMGQSAFEKLQDMWAQSGNRKRWSVAFPVIRTWRFVNDYRAKDVFDRDLFVRIYNYSTAGLRKLDQTAQDQIAELEVEEIPSSRVWIAIEDEIEIALHPENFIPMKLLVDVGRDIDGAGALEGETEERRVKIKKRAAHVANKFAMKRSRDETLFCDRCKFLPESETNFPKRYWRSCLDVHHKDPLAEGIRYTTTEDFELLCPTCHRIEHIKIKLEYT